jgi:NNP family nitrate/nitrite transporter-like MFS transporter
MRSHKVEQLGIATVGFFWCFLMWFSTAAFSPSIAATYHLTINDLGLLASSAIWMAPVGRIVAGWASDRFGAPRTFAAILAGCGLGSIASAFTTSYELLFVERVVVAIAGVSFVVGVQHMAQWFDAHEIGTQRDFMPAPAMLAPVSAHCCYRAPSAPTIGAHFCGSARSLSSSPPGICGAVAPPRR